MEMYKWSSPLQELEPYKVSPVTLEIQKDDKNLNSRYPWRFMKVLTGPNYSNEGVIDRMLVEDEKTQKKANVYTNKEMEEIHQKQLLENDDPPGDNQGGGNVYHDFNSDTSQYPKNPSKQKFTLDQLTPPPNGVLPSYEVTYYFGLPAEDNGYM